MKLDEYLVEKRTLYKGRILNLRDDTVLLSNGKTAFREVVEHHGGAAIIALNKKKEIYLVKQFRYPYKETLLEIPAGKLSEGEDPKECARRELKEETGYTSNSLTLLNIAYPTPGYSDEKIHIYLAEGLTQGNACPDNNEILEFVTLPFEKALNMVNSGKIRDAKTIIAIYHYALYLNK